MRVMVVCTRFRDVMEWFVTKPDYSEYAEAPAEFLSLLPLRYPRLIREAHLSVPAYPHPDFTDDQIRRIVKKCLLLRSLSLCGCRRLTDASLIAIGNCSVFLEDLSISRCSLWLTDIGLSALVRGCSNLTALDISQSEQVTDASLIEMSRCCHNLQALKLSKCIKVTDRGLLAVCTGCPRLSDFHVSLCLRERHLRQKRRAELLGTRNLGMPCFDRRYRCHTGSPGTELPQVGFFERKQMRLYY